MATVFVVDSKGNIALVKRCTNSVSSKGDKADFHLARNSKDIAKAQIFTWAGEDVSPLLVPKRLNAGWLLCSAVTAPRETAGLGLPCVDQL